jgi:hypothetical protein
MRFVPQLEELACAQRITASSRALQRGKTARR